MVSSVVAYYTGDWRWGLRIAPFLNMAAIVLMVFFCRDPPRGEADMAAAGEEEESHHAVAAAATDVKGGIEDVFYKYIELEFITTLVVAEKLLFRVDVKV